MSENLLVPFLPIVMDNDKDFIEILTCSMKLLMNKDIFFYYIPLQAFLFDLTCNGHKKSVVYHRCLP
jgi:hypothetical protein